MNQLNKEQILFDFYEQPHTNNSESIYLDEDDCIIMSLKPEAFNLIFTGRKKFEFRKRWRKRGCIAFIYVSGSHKAIEGIVVLGAPIKDTAEKISQLAEKVIPGNGKSVYDYFIEQGYGLAIPILAKKKIEPISLKEAREKYNFFAPQFFINLKQDEKIGVDLFEAAKIPKLPISFDKICNILNENTNV
ncbi:hypothetical protein ACSHU8_13760 [Acinetobacter baumannii]|uniref:hypothetical protein n=1 Tax=Acinetobacter baumannii TaxID=470 RepID=UPI00233F9813|nr:hypothetical protein [Acinetobacter baumannii]